MQDITVGPVETGQGVSYRYRIGNRLSERRYANSASARNDAHRPQLVNDSGHLEPAAERDVAGNYLG